MAQTSASMPNGADILRLMMKQRVESVAPIGPPIESHPQAFFKQSVENALSRMTSSSEYMAAVAEYEKEPEFGAWDAAVKMVPDARAVAATDAAPIEPTAEDGACLPEKRVPPPAARRDSLGVDGKPMRKAPPPGRAAHRETATTTTTTTRRPPPPASQRRWSAVEQQNEPVAAGEAVAKSTSPTKALINPRTTTTSSHKASVAAMVEKYRQAVALAKSSGRVAMVGGQAGAPGHATGPMDGHHPLVAIVKDETHKKEVPMALAGLPGPQAHGRDHGYMAEPEPRDSYSVTAERDSPVDPGLTSPPARVDRMDVDRPDAYLAHAHQAQAGRGQSQVVQGEDRPRDTIAFPRRPPPAVPNAGHDEQGYGHGMTDAEVPARTVDRAHGQGMQPLPVPALPARPVVRYVYQPEDEEDRPPTDRSYFSVNESWMGRHAGRAALVAMAARGWGGPVRHDDHHGHGHGRDERGISPGQAQGGAPRGSALELWAKVCAQAQSEVSDMAFQDGSGHRGDEHGHVTQEQPKTASLWASLYGLPAEGKENVRPAAPPAAPGPVPVVTAQQVVDVLTGRGAAGPLQQAKGPAVVHIPLAGLGSPRPVRNAYMANNSKPHGFFTGPRAQETALNMVQTLPQPQHDRQQGTGRRSSVSGGSASPQQPVPVNARRVSTSSEASGKWPSLAGTGRRGSAASSSSQPDLVRQAHEAVARMEDPAYVGRAGGKTEKAKAAHPAPFQAPRPVARCTGLKAQQPGRAVMMPRQGPAQAKPKAALPVVDDVSKTRRGSRDHALADVIIDAATGKPISHVSGMAMMATHGMGPGMGMGGHKAGPTMVEGRPFSLLQAMGPAAAVAGMTVQGSDVHAVSNGPGKRAALEARLASILEAAAAVMAAHVEAKQRQAMKEEH